MEPWHCSTSYCTETAASASEPARTVVQAAPRTLRELYQARRGSRPWAPRRSSRRGLSWPRARSRSPALREARVEVFKLFLLLYTQTSSRHTQRTKAMWLYDVSGILHISKSSLQGSPAGDAGGGLRRGAARWDAPAPPRHAGGRGPR